MPLRRCRHSGGRAPYAVPSIPSSDRPNRRTVTPSATPAAVMSEMKPRSPASVPTYRTDVGSSEQIEASSDMAVRASSAVCDSTSKKTATWRSPARASARIRDVVRCASRRSSALIRTISTGDASPLGSPDSIHESPTHVAMRTGAFTMHQSFCWRGRWRMKQLRHAIDNSAELPRVHPRCACSSTQDDRSA